jgi:hypothetical protein
MAGAALSDIEDWNRLKAIAQTRPDLIIGEEIISVNFDDGPMFVIMHCGWYGSDFNRYTVRDVYKGELMKNQTLHCAEECLQRLCLLPVPTFPNIPNFRKNKFADRVGDYLRVMIDNKTYYMCEQYVYSDCCSRFHRIIARGDVIETRNGPMIYSPEALYQSLIGWMFSQE